MIPPPPHIRPPSPPPRLPPSAALSPPARSRQTREVAQSKPGPRPERASGHPQNHPHRRNRRGGPLQEGSGLSLSGLAQSRRFFHPAPEAKDLQGLSQGFGCSHSSPETNRATFIRPAARTIRFPPAPGEEKAYADSDNSCFSVGYVEKFSAGLTIPKYFPPHPKRNRCSTQNSGSFCKNKTTSEPFPHPD